MLLRRAKLCHRRLASLQRKLASGGQSSGDQDQHAMRVHMKELLAVIQEAGRFLKDYSKGGFFKRMITSSSDKEKLDSLDTRLGNAMQVGPPFLACKQSVPSLAVRASTFRLLSMAGKRAPASRSLAASCCLAEHAVHVCGRSHDR